MRPRRPSVTTLLSRIRACDLAAHSDTELRDAMGRLRSQTADGACADDLLQECFAITAEVIDRRLGAWRLFDGQAETEVSGGEDIITAVAADVTEQRRYRRPGDTLLAAAFYAAVRQRGDAARLRFRPTDEQVLAGIHLFRGRVVQMDAGEGKTVAIAFAAVLHAVLGRRVHVITANDYLAERDASLLDPVYRSLGLSAGSVPGYMEEAERRHVYRRNIVYGAMRELGFDYLRDNLKTSAAARVQQSLDVAIVDEADHALIDEAFTPLIISGNPTGGSRAAIRVNTAVARMIERQRDYVLSLAADIGTSGEKSGGPLHTMAVLLLADPDNPALQRRLADDPRLRRRVSALAEDEQDALTADLHYAVHPNHRVGHPDRQGPRAPGTPSGSSIRRQRAGRGQRGKHARWDCGVPIGGPSPRPALRSGQPGLAGAAGPPAAEA